MLHVRDLVVEVGGRAVVQGATFTVRAGEKVGLVGRNGAGKTSMLSVLAGDSPAAAGAALRHGALGYLRQEARPAGSGVDATALSHILSGRGLDDAARRLEKLRLAVEEDPSERNVGRFARAEDAFTTAGGYAAEAEVRRIVAGLGLAPDRVDLPLAVLSGGERRRVELARILFAGSDLLLLDEPTNHLDTDAAAWLMGFLRSYRGALLVVSHDLDLLDEAITRILHLDGGEVIAYKGTYSQYLAARRRDEERVARLAERQAAEIQRLATLADSMRGQTQKRARAAKSIDARVARLEAAAVTGPSRERRASVRFPPPPPSGRLVVEVEGLTKAYGGPPVLDGVSFAVERGQRLLVLGLNGAGKTTLLRILAGVMPAGGGHVRFGHGVSAGYYAQEHEGIDAGRDVLSHLRAESSLPDQELRSLLGMVGLTGDVAFQDAGTLSGGEKTKLAMAQLMVGRHNLLLLDEPTN
ncbi:MAG: ATP-binding cassette domain-containing protein, partial [Actinomycetota bacterium]|nr:ATP-binding cassette domain-containing protein [Actinomycetota bacterium]